MGIHASFGNAYDYVMWRSDLTFEEAPLNEVDIFLLSQFATPDFRGIISGNVYGITLEEVCRKYFETHTTDKSNIGLLQSDYLLPTLKEAAKSRRYGKLELCGYIDRVKDEEAEQFSAIMTSVDPGLVVVTFMGTDDTLTGWKEDFNLCMDSVLPSQRDAQDYLTWASEVYPKARIGVCGHSKGGNLALFSAATVAKEVQDRIDFVYDLDGPGLKDWVLNTEGYERIHEKITTIVSEQTTIGTLLNMGMPLTVVQTTATGMVAHDAFTWKVIKDHFIRAEKLSRDSILFGYTINNVIKDLPKDRKKTFVDVFFDIITSTGARTVTDVKNTDVRDLLHALSKLSRNEDMNYFANLLKKEAERTLRHLRKGELKSWENTD